MLNTPKTGTSAAHPANGDALRSFDQLGFSTLADDDVDL